MTAPENKESATASAVEVIHGDLKTYDNIGCRCFECALAKAEDVRLHARSRLGLRRRTPSRKKYS